VHSSTISNVANLPTQFGNFKIQAFKEGDKEHLAVFTEYIPEIPLVRVEGRNIGLFNKVNAYALQDKGFDTIEANHQLGFKADERTYDVVCEILNHLGVKKLRLLTNNPKKMDALEGFDIVERVPIIIEPNEYNINYLNIFKIIKFIKK